VESAEEQQLAAARFADTMAGHGIAPESCRTLWLSNGSPVAIPEVAIMGWRLRTRTFDGSYQVTHRDCIITVDGKIVGVDQSIPYQRSFTPGAPPFFPHLANLPVYGLSDEIRARLKQFGTFENAPVPTDFDAALNWATVNQQIQQTAKSSADMLAQNLADTGYQLMISTCQRAYTALQQAGVEVFAITDTYRGRRVSAHGIPIYSWAEAQDVTCVAVCADGRLIVAGGTSPRHESTWLGGQPRPIRRRGARTLTLRNWVSATCTVQGGQAWVPERPQFHFDFYVAVDPASHQVQIVNSHFHYSDGGHTMPLVEFVAGQTARVLAGGTGTSLIS
jgi:hypothetical protein